MLPTRFQNIKAKLIFSFSLFMLIIILIIATFIWFDTKNRSIEYVIGELKDVKLTVKEILNTERDFTIYETINSNFYKTRKSKYLSKNKALIKHLKNDLGNLNKNKSLLNLTAKNKIRNLDTLTNDSKLLFNKYVKGTLKRGFKDYGLIGEMRKHIHEIENIKGLDLAKVLMIRRHEKDYLIRKEKKYVKKIEKAIKDLQKNANNNLTDAKNLIKINKHLKSYFDIFQKVVDLNLKLGLANNEDGLRNNITEQLTKIENIINQLDKDIINITNIRKTRIQIILIVFILISLFAGIILVFLIISQLQRPITLLSKSIHNVIEKEFAKDVKIAKINSRDEIGMLSKDVTLMLDKMHKQTSAFYQQKKELEESYQKIELLSEIGQKITREITIENIVNTIYKNLDELINATVIAIGIHEKNHNRLKFYGGKEKDIDYGYDDLNDKHKLSVQCFLEEKEILIDDLEREYQKFAPHIGLIINNETQNSMIYQPMLANDKKIGVVTVQHIEKNTYNELQADILKNIAVYAAIAIDNAKAYQTMEEQREELLASEEELRQNSEELKAVNEKLEETVRRTQDFSN